MRNRLLLLGAILAAALALGGPIAVRADEGLDASGEDSDHDRARDLLEHGEINPLGEIIARLSGEHPGEVVGISLDKAGGRWVYTFKILAPDGRLQEFSVDAKSMNVIGHEGDD